METKIGTTPPKDTVIYLPRAPRNEQFVLSPPKRFEQNKLTLKVPKMYIPKGTYVARGPIISPRLTEPVVISRALQNPMKDPTVIPWNYKKAVVKYKGKEIMGEYEEEAPCPQPFLSNTSIMVASEMIKHGYKLGKGLEASLQGITQPNTLTANKKFFVVGFQATEADVLMDEEDAKKTAFTTPWGTYCYRIMPFGLKNAGATYMRAMTVIFHDMMHQEIEVYVDDVDGCVSRSFRQDQRISVESTSVTGRPLFLYLTVLENSSGCVLGQHDVTGKREQAIYYLSKKFTSYEAKYTLLERSCCAVTWVAQKLRHYLLSYTTYLITRLDPLKYIFQKPMPTGKLAKWQILLTKFDIVYVTRTIMKAQALVDHLAENPVDDKYQPLSTYFSDKEVNSVEVILEDTNAWKMFFNRAVNAKASSRLIGNQDIKLILYRQHMEDHSKRFKYVEFRYILRFHDELADALATLASMLPYPGNVHIDPLEIQIRERHGYCNAVEVELDVQPWYHDIKRFLKIKEYPEQASGDQKRTIRRLACSFFLSREVLYKRTPDLNLLRCVDAQEDGKIMNELHVGVCGPYMNIYVLAKKILQAGYY
ncbi:uncharacterized protein [Nicotiana sylvestris]|uniref:uncharacterized protein n=1 Tax=Nicotiana sylvestris TaxID=4096 RepID=UPI00388C40D9